MQRILGKTIAPFYELLYRDRTPNSARSAVEGNHEAITNVLDLAAAGCFDRLA
jgi:hypothetical protein